MSFSEALGEATAQAGLELQPRQLNQLAEHFALVQRWNKVHNLTRLTGVQEAIKGHYLDCLLGLQALRQSGRLRGPALDVGSGAGFPGLVAAIVEPDIEWTLVDAAAKRCSFLELASAKLSNLRVEHATFQSLTTTWPTVTSRATLPPERQQDLKRLVSRGGCLAVWAREAPGAIRLRDDLDVWIHEAIGE